MHACSASGDTPLKQNSVQKKLLGFQYIKPQLILLVIHDLHVC